MSKIALTAGLVAALLLQPAPAVATGTGTWPVRGEVITPYRNGDDPYAAGQHRGIDIAAPVGARVSAATAGTIVFAGVVGSSGLTVSERTADGRYELSYLHLSAASVRAGAHVAAGEQVGAVGTSGQRSATQPHLHFGVREADSRRSYLDPLSFLAPPAADPPASPPLPAPVPVESPARPFAASAPVPTLRPLPLLQPYVTHPARAGQPAAASHPAAAHAGEPGPHARRLSTSGVQPAAYASRSHLAHVARGPAPHGERGHAPARGAHGSGAAALGAAPAPASGAPHSSAPRHGAARSGHRGGLDLGWLAACVGLVAAAAMLANPARARGAARHSREGVGALLRPLLRRT